MVVVESKVLGRYMVAPPDGTVEPAKLPLTFFDLFCFPTQAIRYLFFYLVPDECIATTTNFSQHFREHHLEHLIHSLSIALQPFYPLAGTVVTPPDGTSTPYISYSDGDSVELTVMESTDDIRELAAHDPKDSSRFDPLIPFLASSPSTQEIQRGQPIMALQVTLFPVHRGIAIGLCLNHGVADGSSTMHFFKTWATLCKRSLLQETTTAVQANGRGTSALPFRAHATGADRSVLTTMNHPFRDRGAVTDPEGIKDIFWADINRFKSTQLTVSHPDIYSPPGVLRATFVLTRDHIDDLRSKAAPPPGTRYSSLTMALALAWVCSVKAHGRLDELKKFLGFPADLRKRLQHPLPATYFGNCIAYGIVEAPTQKLVGESGLAEAAAAISDVVRKLDRGALEGAKDWVKTLFTTSLPEALAVTGSPRFGMYESDFGWGSPLKVEMVNWEASGSLSLAESGQGGLGGIQVGLALPGPVMTEFIRHFHAAIGQSRLTASPARKCSTCYTGIQSV